MIKLITGFLLAGAIMLVNVPEVKVAGTMKNIMMKGDLSAHLNLDTVNKTNLYGLGPVAGLKGEIIILDGKVYTTSLNGKQLENKENKVSSAAMLVYCYVPKWKAITIDAAISNYAELESVIEKTAAAEGIDAGKPFPFKIAGTTEKATYHIIDWKEGVDHTIDNHKKFAFAGNMVNQKVTMLGFYSKHHQSIFTHHTTFMHVHIMDDDTKNVGHLDELQLNGLFTVYLPEQ
ncbi:MAG: acetolactate decarboxylase [Rhizobacter sp.]|nr:acetolactate decarboxylase [Ferruginibacter sp.]